MTNPWILAARPRTLPAAIVPVVIGFALVFEQGALRAVPACVLLLTAVLIQVICNYANDVLDFERGTDTAERLGPVRATQAGIITPEKLKAVTAALIGVCLLLGGYLVSIAGWPILIIGVLSLAFAILYTAGPFALAYLGLGEVFVILFFGPVAVGGTQYFFTGGVESGALLIGAACGLISAALLAVNNLRDIDSDRKSRKYTLAVRFGERFARFEYAGLLLAAAVLAVLSPILHPEHRWSALAALFILPGIPVIAKVVSAAKPVSGTELNGVLESTGKLLVLFGVLFALSYTIL